MRSTSAFLSSSSRARSRAPPRRSSSPPRSLAAAGRRVAAARSGLVAGVAARRGVLGGDDLDRRAPRGSEQLLHLLRCRLGLLDAAAALGRSRIRARAPRRRASALVHLDHGVRGVIRPSTSRSTWTPKASTPYRAARSTSPTSLSLLSCARQCAIAYQNPAVADEPLPSDARDAGVIPESAPSSRSALALGRACRRRGSQRSSAAVPRRAPATTCRRARRGSGRPLARRRDRRREGRPHPRGAVLRAAGMLRRPRPRAEGRAHVALRRGRQRGDRRGRARASRRSAPRRSPSTSPSSCASARARRAPR